jgi:hypothetical protein
VDEWSTEPRPDKVEKGLRFGCGFVFGAIATATSWIVLTWPWSTSTVLLLMGLGGL